MAAKVSTEGMNHFCKNCGTVGRPKNAELALGFDALGNTGLHTNTTVECKGCGYWNYHAPPAQDHLPYTDRRTPKGS